MHKELMKIKTDCMRELLNGSAYEMADVIFDTLFKNKQFPQFVDDLCGGGEVDRSKAEIRFEYMGHCYAMKVDQIEDGFFDY